ncbi:MAG: hypothetical protein GIW95_10265 [Candidatus Eremiobacteraeota bacterium]|nr:hypothetical protein [Candidatus Eremiobacteraeota bacterium]
MTARIERRDHKPFDRSVDGRYRGRGFLGRRFAGIRLVDDDLTVVVHVPSDAILDASLGVKWALIGDEAIIFSDAEIVLDGNGVVG